MTAKTLVAFSGGADSTALLVMYLERGETPGAAHFNHGIRGAEAERDAEFCREFCRERGVPFYLGSGAAKSENDGRVQRYAFLRETAKRHGYRKIAVAHNADDNAETVLLNLIRGSGIRGLRGIPRENGGIIRPVLDYTHEELIDFLKVRNVPHILDSTNFSLDYRRNRIRNTIFPLLKNENPRVVEAINRAAKLLAEDAEFSASIEAESDVGTLREMRPGERSHALRALFRKTAGDGVDLYYEHVKLLEKLVFSDNPSASANLPRGLTARREYGVLKIEKPRKSGGFEIYFGAPEKIHKKAFSFSVKSDIIKGDIILRSRRDGDRVKLRGRPEKLLSDLFIDAKIPRSERDKIPIAADGGGILAVYGFGASERAEPGDLTITIFEKE